MKEPKIMTNKYLGIYKRNCFMFLELPQKIPRNIYTTIYVCIPKVYLQYNLGVNKKSTHPSDLEVYLHYLFKEFMTTIVARSS